MNAVTSSRGEGLLVYVPSQVQAGGKTSITIVATHPNGRVNHNYTGTVCVAASDERADGVGEVDVIPVSGGAHKHALRWRTPGVQWVVVSDKQRGWETRSNPIEVLEDGRDVNLFWGDLHVHAGERWKHRGISDAYAPIDYNYFFGRHVAALDFMALSDHDQLATWRSGIIPIWDRFKRAAEYFNTPGTFVTLLGWEWTNGVSLCPGRPQYGQKCVYYRGADGPIFSSADSGSDTPEKLYELLRGHRCFLIPHHVSAPLGFYNDWDYHDPSLERLVEIHSCWGCGERSAEDGNPYPIVGNASLGTGDVKGHHVRDALARGHTLGFTAGGDTHDAAPGIGYLYNGLEGAFEAKRWGSGKQHHPGIQGVWAEALTREAIFEAIHARRTYGTSGARIIVKTEMDGWPMGTVSGVRPKKLGRFKASVVGTAPIELLEVVCNGETIYREMPEREQVELTYEVGDVSSERVHYYLRVTQKDGHMAWSSPHYFPASE